ncbi:hypothetical protein SerAS12_2812 [Serratia sp. AS12]|uniref:DUF2570 domain-containing protein n=1 Tax=Serratia TaxID=613 RepID=UPI00020E9A53|nr:MULTISPECIES: DUF2570 domain-containing protein [Serratia]AEF45931.1 hypothetical protein SerAS9_2811 [Serratia plymuthica AS9]AEF50882.1 hypothetical protein SerAS12_2812 [Serratia sp. AS12]AEG28589.1 hypothetical protein SerAS13_2813 [Serratia sp. AS13]
MPGIPMNWFPLPNGKALLVAAVLGLYTWLALSNLGYRKDLARAQQVAEEQKKTLDRQAGLIVTLQTQDAQNRALMAAQLQQEQQLRQQHDAAQRKLRDALKNDACAAKRMPGAVLELLRPANSATIGAAVPSSP